MPLLKKRIFEKQTVPEYLRDDEKVFHCEITNEIFRDYEEFSERMFLCNSMVWTCSMTGKTNLTYQEAIESEEQARECLKNFPKKLILPILFMAHLTKRTAISEVLEDIFSIVKDKYFIGENVEACFTTNKWKDCHINSVIPPKEKEIKLNGDASTSQETGPLASGNQFKYEIEHLDSEDNDISEIMIVDSTQVRRKKLCFSKDKLKLLLRQHLEQDSQGIFIIKQSIIEKYRLNEVQWESIFAGPLPNFECSKKIEKPKVATSKKKKKQKTLTDFLQQNGLVMNNNNNNHARPSLIEQMKVREAEFKKQKELEEARKAEEKAKEKQRKLLLLKHLKDWLAPKEDLELEDQSKFPDLTPVKSTISNDDIGDVLMILEFVQSFGKLLPLKSYFPNGFTFDVLDRALIEKELSGPLINLIQMFLKTIFQFQEKEHYSIDSEGYSNYNEANITSQFEKGIYLATMASQLSKKCYGFPLNQLPLCPLTLTEILRLHLLSSGAKIKSLNLTLQRGNYSHEDDPGLYLRLNNAKVLKYLSYHNIVQLSVSDKLKIICCLVNQLLTYTDVREMVEDRLEVKKTTKFDLKASKILEKKMTTEYANEKLNIQKDMTDDPEGMIIALNKIDHENERKHKNLQTKIDNLSKLACEKQVSLGTDRAYRRYLKLESVPGIFINWEDEHTGPCQNEPTVQHPDLINAERKDLMSYLSTLHNLDNDDEQNNGTINGLEKVNGCKNDKSVLETDKEMFKDLLLCTTNINDCPIHSTVLNRCKWSFIRNSEQLEELIKALNKRGCREGEIRDFLLSEKCNLEKLIEKTPVNKLNVDLQIEQEPDVHVNGTRKKEKYEDPNLGYPANMDCKKILENVLVDKILELETRISAGSIGTLKYHEREKWRQSLQDLNYEEFKAVRNYSQDNDDEIDRGSPFDKSTSHEHIRKLLHIDESDRDDIQTSTERMTISCLADALSDVAEAVYPDCLKVPLKNDSQLKKWKQSLLVSTSFSQIFLHYSTLNSCILKKKPFDLRSLPSRCLICRVHGDSECFVTCDSCSNHYHTYCHEPALASVPKGKWTCSNCLPNNEVNGESKAPPRKRRKIAYRWSDSEEEEGNEKKNESETEKETNGTQNYRGKRPQHDEVNEKERRKHRNEKEKNEYDSEENMESDDDYASLTVVVEVCTTCRSGGELIICDECKSSYHKECIDPPLRRSPRGVWKCNSCSEDIKNKKYLDTKRKITRRDLNREDLPLNNSVLQKLLSDVMKQESAWPFLRPVQPKEVPDYYDVIRNPIDLGTIKYKLNVGDYTTDSQLLKDVVLLFENCHTYNSSEDEVFRCGEKLAKYFVQRAKELSVELPPALREYDN